MNPKEFYTNSLENVNNINVSYKSFELDKSLLCPFFVFDQNEVDHLILLVCSLNPNEFFQILDTKNSILSRYKIYIYVSMSVIKIIIVNNDLDDIDLLYDIPIFMTVCELIKLYFMTEKYGYNDMRGHIKPMFKFIEFSIINDSRYYISDIDIKNQIISVKDYFPEFYDEETEEMFNLDYSKKLGRDIYH